MKNPFVSAVVALALLVAPVSAQADTVTLTSTSEYASTVPCGGAVRYDNTGRLWNWSAFAGESCPSTIMKSATKSGGSWVIGNAVNLSDLGIYQLDFATDGSLYGSTWRAGQLKKLTFNSDGSVLSSSTFKLKKKTTIRALTISSSNKMYIVSNNQIEEYRLPLKRNSAKNKPIRSIKFVLNGDNDYPKIAATSNGTIYAIKDSDVYHGVVQVFGPTQKGRATAERSISIDSATSTNGSINELSVTPDQKLAALFFDWTTSGIGVFSDTANGSSVTPETWYPFSGPRWSFDYSSTGTLSVSVYTLNPSNNSVNVYFEPGCAPRPEARC